MEGAPEVYPIGREIPTPEPLAFLETSDIAVRVKVNEPWDKLLGRVFSAAAAYNNLKTRESTKSGAMHSLCDVDLLPMPVCVSPITVAMGQYNGNGKSSPLYVSAFVSLYELHILRIFMKDVCYSRQKEPALYMAMAKLDEALVKDLRVSQVKLQQRLDKEVYDPVANHQLNTATAVYRFVQAMEDETFYILNRYEAYLYDAFCLGIPEDEGPPEIKLQHVLTNNSVRPTGMDMLALDHHQGHQWMVMVRTCEKVLSMRTHLWNERMRRDREQRGDKPHEPVKLFNTENLVVRIRDALQAAQENPKNTRLYRGWLLFDTAREYCNFLNRQYVTDDDLRRLQGPMA